MATSTMKAVLTTGTGDYDKLVYQDVPLPQIAKGEVLIKVLAAGINNTEINTRLGWYSSSVTGSTDSTTAIKTADGGWGEKTPFPFIQGTDCCGEIVSSFDNTHHHLIGRRVLVRPCNRTKDFNSLDNIWMGSDYNGAFAQFVTVRVSEVFPIDCDWSDAQLGTIPCAYGTSENMLHRADLQSAETVLITGASGGVGSATVQLAKRRGSKVIALASANKHELMSELGVDVLLDRSADIIKILGEQSVDVVVDNVAGSHFPAMLKVLKRGGRLVSSGAIAGPIVDLDMRDMYLKDINLIGCTAWDEPVFANLVGYIERGEIAPLLAKSFPLSEIASAQQEFLDKHHLGKFVLIPKHDE